MHEAQRELAEKLIALAKVEAHLPMHERTFVITMDMGQNGAVPLLRSEQMGCFYYMSPLTQLIDGKVDASTGKMNAYIWREGSADRGCDNIVSTLHWDLERHGIIGNKVKKLVAGFCNCDHFEFASLPARANFVPRTTRGEIPRSHEVGPNLVPNWHTRIEDANFILGPRLLSSSPQKQNFGDDEPSSVKFGRRTDHFASFFSEQKPSLEK